MQQKKQAAPEPPFQVRVSIKKDQHRMVLAFFVVSVHFSYRSLEHLCDYSNTQPTSVPDAFCVPQDFPTP